MSLHRLALRLAAVEALCPYALTLTGPWPTLAGPRVFDSRQEPIEVLDVNEAKPILIVYTEMDDTLPYQGRYPANESTVKLTVECLIAARGTLEITNSDGTTTLVGTLTTPVSDSTQEAALDMLEAMVRRVLDTTQLLQASTLYRRIATECHNITSVPLRDANRTVRLLGRSVTFTLKTLAEEWPDTLVNATGIVPVLAGLARLPLPLSLVAASVDPASPAGLTCAQIASAMPNGEGLIPLAGISIYTNMLNPPTPANSQFNSSVISTP